MFLESLDGKDRDQGTNFVGKASSFNDFFSVSESLYHPELLAEREREIKNYIFL